MSTESPQSSTKSSCIVPLGNERHSMSMIESFPTSESNYPAQKADNSDDDLVFIMNVKRKDGTADRVVVRPSDDPYKLALDYVQKYNLCSKSRVRP